VISIDELLTQRSKKGMNKRVVSVRQASKNRVKYRHSEDWVFAKCTITRPIILGAATDKKEMDTRTAGKLKGKRGAKAPHQGKMPGEAAAEIRSADGGRNTSLTTAEKEKYPMKQTVRREKNNTPVIRRFLVCNVIGKS
jgi:hypothetical protein